MAKTEDEIIHTAMQSWRDKDKTNEFWFKSLIQGAWRSGYTNARNELHGAFESATEAEKNIAYQHGLEDAWVAAKRVFAEMDYDECIECFGEEFSEDNLTMFDRFSATDVIQMLKWQRCDQCKFESCEECCLEWLREEATDGQS